MGDFRIKTKAWLVSLLCTIFTAGVIALSVMLQ